jgi:hypothetical protein
MESSREGGGQQTTDTSTTRTSESITQEQPGHLGIAPAPDGIGNVVVIPDRNAEVNRETVTETSHTQTNDKEEK